MKRIILLLCILTIVVGCDSSKKEKKAEEDYSKYKLITCTRDANSSMSDIKVDLSYKIYHNDKYVMRVIATDIISSKNKDNLNEYVESYKNIYEKYEGLKYFSNKITVKNDTMTSITNIDYEHIDTDKLLEIEGKEDNVISEDGKVLLDDFIKFYEKYGAECDS